MKAQSTRSFRRGGNGNVERLHGTDWRLPGERELPLGSHVVTPRRGYLHHGVYVGDGKVVHYAGLGSGLRRGPVEEVSLVRFAKGRPVWLRSGVSAAFDRLEVVNRARSRLGEHGYRLLTNNCEHFCEWCIHGEPRSLQIEAWLSQPVRTLFGTINFVRNSIFAEHCAPGFD